MSQQFCQLTNQGADIAVEYGYRILRFSDVSNNQLIYLPCSRAMYETRLQVSATD